MLLLNVAAMIGVQKIFHDSDDDHKAESIVRQALVPERMRSASSAVKVPAIRVSHAWGEPLRGALGGRISTTTVAPSINGNG